MWLYKIIYDKNSLAWKIRCFLIKNKYTKHLFELFRRTRDSIADLKPVLLFLGLHNYANREKKSRRFRLRDCREYRIRWKELYKRNPCIYIYDIDFCGIGETFPRLYHVINREKKTNGHEIVMPTFGRTYLGGLVNSYLLELFRQDIYIIRPEDIGFWTYVFLLHMHRVNISEIHRFEERKTSCGIYGYHEQVIPISKELEDFGTRELKRMNIDGPYVCIHAREDATKTDTHISSYPDTSTASTDLSLFEQTVAYLHSRGYSTVRTGKDEKKEVTMPYLIDYANKFRTEKMDFYLIANCKFMVSSPSGIAAIAPFFGTPVLFVNFDSLGSTSGENPCTKYDMYLPSYFYSKKENRMLNIYEIYDVSSRCERYKELYEKEGVELRKNTQEEILEATKEMEARINGEWNITEEEQKTMNRYWEIIDKWMERNKEVHLPYRRPIAYSFLKNNLWLLDV